MVSKIERVEKLLERTAKQILETIIFSSRWLLIPFYLKLFWTLMMLGYYFIFCGHVDNEQIIHALHDVDNVMIANLVKMIITGSYNSFVSKDHGYKNENNTSGVLKVKIATSMMGICSIVMLQEFLAETPIDSNTLHLQLFIFAAIVVGAIVLSIIDFFHTKCEVMEDTHKNVKH